MWAFIQPSLVSVKTVVPADTGNNIIYARKLQNVGSADGEFWIRHRYKEAVESGAQVSGPGVSRGLTQTTVVGAAFTNQPSDDGLEMVSSDGGDVTQTVTVYYTRIGQGDTCYTETKTLTGASQVVFTDTNINKVLGAEKSATTTGTVTIREASGNQTVTTLAPSVLSSGVWSVVNPGVDPIVPGIVASGSSTKQIGLVGTDSGGSALRDSQALTGTTEALMNSTFYTVTKVLIGDLESTRTVTLRMGCAVVAYLAQGDSMELPASALGVNLTGLTAGVELVAYY